jgi:hypothetical protein
MIGAALGYYIPTLYINEDVINDKEQFKLEMYKIFRDYSILAVVNCLLIIAFFENKPKIPPS